jgi:type II secretory pathway component PulJ
MTLAELLTSITVLAVLMAGMLGILDQGQRAYAMGAARVEAQQNARVALTRIAADLRHAGAGGRGFDAISIAEPERVMLHQDLDGDGLVAGSGETVMWRLSGGTLRRATGAGGAQPVLDGVEHFALTYFDAGGAPTTVPAAVRSVSITLTTRAQLARLPGAATGAFVIATRVRLRNR